MGQINLLSIDVEDWFHILDVPSTPGFDRWDALPSRIEKNFMTLLDRVDATPARATCFCLAWVAQRFPKLLKEADARGHEIASHGCAHELIYRQTKEVFIRDVQDAKRILEDVVGKPVLGYRAPGFSVTERTPWFFDALVEAGYRYDSSVFPAPRGHGGLVSGRREPYTLDTSFGSLHEFPISTAELFGKRFCFSGGGYFRLLPYRFISYQVRKLNRQNLPVIVYLHPREIDPDQPRMPMGRYRRFKSYVNLHTTEPKLQRLLSDFPFTTFRDYIRSIESASPLPSGES